MRGISVWRTDSKFVHILILKQFRFKLDRRVRGEKKTKKRSRRESERILQGAGWLRTCWSKRILEAIADSGTAERLHMEWQAIISNKKNDI